MVKNSSQSAGAKGAKATKTVAKKSYTGLIIALASGFLVLLVTAITLAIVLPQLHDSNSGYKHNCPAGYVWVEGSNGNPGECEDDSGGIKKPIIYLYPTETTEVSVQVSHPENFTVEYPTYGDGWRVLAAPNGDLRDLNGGRELYSLYYESKNLVPAAIEKDGFVVKGGDTAEFLETTLPKLGLNPREAEEFIIYWLPQLQDSPYNYIRFQTAAEIDANQTLSISPRPDTMIRVMMSYASLDAPIEVEPQQITTPSRDGFVVVEWGGTRIGVDTVK
jgi:hypothetical protein